MKKGLESGRRGPEAFAVTSTVEFTFRPEGDRTAVTWSMVGKVNFVGKAVHLFVDMDTMIGTNFEKGLTDMKAVVETTRSQR